MRKKELKKAAAACLAAGLILTEGGCGRAAGAAGETAGMTSKGNMADMAAKDAGGQIIAAKGGISPGQTGAAAPMDAKKPVEALIGDTKTEEEKITEEDAKAKNAPEENTSFHSAESYREILDVLGESRTGFVQWGWNQYFLMDGVSGGMYDTAMNETAAMPGAAESAEPSGKDYSDTNVQVEGIVEADIVKTDGEYIYILSKSENLTKIFIVRAENGALVSESSFSPEAASNAYAWQEEMYVSGNRLVIVRQTQKEREVTADDDDYYNRWLGYYAERQTQILIYDITDRRAPVLAAEHVQDGDYVSSREKDGYLYVISEKGTRYNYIPYFGVFEVDDIIVPELREDASGSGAVEKNNSAGETNQDSKGAAAQETNGDDKYADVKEANGDGRSVMTAGTKTGEEDSAADKASLEEALSAEERAQLPQADNTLLAPDCIYFRADSNDSVYTIVTAICLDEPEKFADSLSFVAKSDHCYMSGNAIYLAAYDWWNYEERECDETDLVKISYQDGRLSLAAQGKIKGSLDDQFSMDEKDGYLRIVTTVNHYRLVQERDYTWQEQTGMTNSLYVLDAELILVGSIENLAEDEMIYSARFLGDIAYFVTFRNTDPLFSVDLSDPANPVLLGALKIPGFSDYLHPYGENLLLGIGYDTNENGSRNGVKLTMFDISDPRNVVEKHTLLLDNYITSEACTNHKAVLVDEERAFVGLPLAGSYYGNGIDQDYKEVKAYAVYGYDEEKGFYPKFEKQYQRVWDQWYYYIEDEEIRVPDEEPGMNPEEKTEGESAASQTEPVRENSVYSWNDWYCMRLRGIYIGDYFYLVNQMEEVRSWKMGQDGFEAVQVLELNVR